MRTRFLNTDFFFSAQTLTEALRSLNLLSLPSPLPESNPPFELELPLSELEIPIDLEIDRFEFSGALSDFLSGVIPQFLDDGGGGIASSERAGVDEPMKEVQFELVEMEFPLRECISSCGLEEAGVGFEIPCVKIPLDDVDIKMELTITYPSTIAKSISLVEDIPDSSSVKDDSSSSDNISKHTFKVPHFEVREIGLGFEGSLSNEEAFSGMLPAVELHHRTNGDELVVNAKEFSASTNIDILEDLSTCVASEDCTEDKSVSFNSVLEMNVIHLNGNMFLEENSGIYPITSTGDCSPILRSLRLQEVEILDISSDDIFEVLSSSEAEKDLDISEQMFKNDMDSVGIFYESLVSSELALVDDTFKSLPVPILHHDKDMKSRDLILRDALHILKPHRMTACDGLYLDWHPLMEGTCNSEICSTYMCIVQEVSSYSIASELGFTGEDTIYIDTTFLDDSLERPNVLYRKEVLSELQRNIPSANDPCARPALSRTPKEDSDMAATENHMLKTNADKASSLFSSMSQSNDLNFFLDVCRGTSRKSCGEGTMNGFRGKVIPSDDPLKEPSDLPNVDFVKWDIKVHQVYLSDPILELIDHIQKSYLAILKYGTDLRSTGFFPTTDDSEFLSLSKQKLLKLISDRSENQLSSGCMDEAFVGLLAIYAIKQLAYLLCFYGIHAALLYISNLTRNADVLVVRLRPLESMLEVARQKAEKQLIESHPSLSLLDSLLRSSGHQNSKILIIAERFLWLPLNQKLTCMNIKFHEVRESYKISNEFDARGKSGFPNYILETLEHSDCILISHENVSASFPFNTFKVIFEYGGPSASSRLSKFTSLSLKLRGYIQVHFLKVSMENHSLPKKFCEGFDVNQHLSMEGHSKSKLSLQRNLNSEHIVELVKFVPIEKTTCFSSGSENYIDVSHNESSMSIPQLLNSKDTSSDIPSSPDVVIVVNTQNFGKKMLISRRSSYQKILALEKRGAQVVEREISLPIDLIFNAAICLVWYETQNLGDNTAVTTSIPMFMENIATNILMSLSFAFSGCILIFEGESSFLSAIMESSDALYAAAASLDLNLQLFCSYMPESTDEIILNCIGNATRLNRGLYPAMPESETLGESFLTMFPSINPLSAHAILSSGGMLIEFLEWSQERRIQSIGKYHIPDQSINLFNVLCRFGEMGESKSVMTECSSVDSDINSGKLQSEKKRKKCVMSSQNIDMPMDETFYFGSFSKRNNRRVELPRSSQLYNSRNDFNIQDMRTVCDEMFMNDDVFVNERKLNTSISSNFDGGCKVRYSHLKENLGDKVTAHRSIFLDENYSSIPSPISFFGKREPRSEPAVRSSLPDSRTAFNLSGHRTSSNSSDINWDRDNGTSINRRSHSLLSKNIGQESAHSDRDDSPMKPQREYSNGIFNPKCPRHVLGLSNQAIESPLHGVSLNSKVSQLHGLHQGQQRKIDFLHRNSGKKEKLHQKRLKCNTCLSCPGSLKRSPSIIKSFRYQGGNPMSDLAKKWRNKGEVQVSIRNEAKKDSSFNIPSTWTPMDKRARQNLSFTRTGNEKQSKLVWRNRCSPSSDFTRKRYRDEV